jgi:uncharacterized membrane protein YhfC
VERAEALIISYSIEPWDLDAQALERVLARAFSPQLTRAIFHAAQKEHPDQRILLRRGTGTLADSTE